MVYLAQTLITRSWYLSGIVARNQETVSGDQISDGLFLLNALLDFKFSDLHLIPYFRQYSFNMVQGQETYFVPNLSGIESMTFNIQTVRYSMQQVDRKTYFATSRVDNIQSLPYNYHMERKLGGADVYVYFVPQSNYPSKIWGKFALTNVNLNTDLLTVYDAFYIEYLRYALAEYMCNEYNIELQPGAARKLMQLEKKLQSVSPADLIMQKRSTLQQGNSVNYGAVNIGRGWTRGWTT